MNLPTNGTYKNSGNLLGGLKKIADRNKKEKEKENKGINILLIVLVLVSLTLLNKNLRKKYMKFQMIAILILIVSLLFKKDKFAETSIIITGSYLFCNSSPKNIRMIINISGNNENIDLNRGESKTIKINEGDYIDNFGYMDHNGEFKGCTDISNDNCKYAMLVHGGTTDGKQDYIISAISLDALNAPNSLLIETVSGSLTSGISTSCAVKSIENSGGNSEEIAELTLFNGRNKDIVLDKYKLDIYSGKYAVEKVVPNVSITITSGTSRYIEKADSTTDYENGNGYTYIIGGDFPLKQDTRLAGMLEDGSIYPDIKYWRPDFELVNYRSNNYPGILFTDVQQNRDENMIKFVFKNIYGFTMA